MIEVTWAIMATCKHSPTKPLGHQIPEATARTLDLERVTWAGDAPNGATWCTSQEPHVCEAYGPANLNRRVP